MAGVRGLLARVQRLERGDVMHPIARFGTDEFEAEFRASVEANNLDRIDMYGENGEGGVLACLKRWARDQLWLNA